MATIALDASYIFDKYPTGIAIYSRRLIESLAELESAHRFHICYRLSRIGRRREFLCPADPRFSVHLFQRPLTFWQPWRVAVFHSLAQRPPAFRFRHEAVTIHDVFPITGPDYSTPGFQRKFSRLLHLALERAERVLVLSEYTAGQVMKHCGVERERIRVVPGGVDPPSLRLSPEQRLRERERRVGKGNELLLTVGVIDNRKNVVGSLRALQLLPERYRLVVAGGDGYGAEKVHEFVESEKLEGRVLRLGYVTKAELAALFQSASALLFPSLEEGFGFPMLEAMANGLPVVTSRTSALPEVGGEAALYADPHDPADIAAKTQSAVEDDGLRRGLIEKGLARAAHFAWRRTAAGILRVYDELLV
ncbi:MAG TPA: glycosyltransferase family 1 protein [Bryobacteraceae bacterium]|nr:glycosyltransferase family 1 protein [Bryobacteraceae bacterium]